ncbi:GMC oxidoreductase [Agrobacterium sp. 22-221-1]
MVEYNPSASSILFQVCIVGAGPVGLALAFALEGQGVNVLLVEAGRHGLDGRFASVTNHHHAPLDSSTAGGLGGTSSLWGGRCVPFDDIDFLERAHVPNSGWPIRHESVSRYYADALRFLNVTPSTLPPGDAASPAGDVHLEAIEWWSSQPDLGVTCRERIEKSRFIHFLSDTSAKAIEVDATGAITDVWLSNGHGDMRVPVRTLVLACGGVGNVRLLHELRRKQPDRISPMLGHYYQGHLTGYIAVVELEKDATVEELSFQRAPSGGIYRRRFQLSDDVQQRLGLLNSVFWLDTISISNALHHSAGLSALFLALQLTGLYGLLAKGKAAGSCLRTGFRYREHFRNLVLTLSAFRDFQRTISQLLRHRDRRTPLVNPARRYLLRYHAEQIPDYASTVLPRPSGAEDRFAAVAIDYRVSEKDLESIEKSHVFLDQWLRENRLGKLDFLHPPSERRQALRDQAYDGFHQIGLTRMAATADQGVIDSNCKVHGISNLYVAGSCVFPTGGHANPTLPAVALAMRLAGHIGEKLKGHEPALPADM